ncbi:MAG TPA: hypothetical protein VGY54_20875 [Polyangiaceae bacterium]|jgi:hypothetical protein|nr:hypothetical protein [Polyangiaceae bacterium]
MAVVTQSEQSIIGEINAHMQQAGLPNSSWYVGITSDIGERLFGYHKVPRQNHWYIYRQAANHIAARNIEAAYHRAGCKGSGGGGDHTAVLVYAYVITSTTIE